MVDGRTHQFETDGVGSQVKLILNRSRLFLIKDFAILTTKNIMKQKAHYSLFASDLLPPLLISQDSPKNKELEEKKRVDHTKSL